MQKSQNNNTAADFISPHISKETDKLTRRPFDRLPEEMLLEIFSYMDNVSFALAGRVSRRWARVMQLDPRSFVIGFLRKTRTPPSPKKLEKAFVDLGTNISYSLIHFAALSPTQAATLNAIPSTTQTRLRPDGAILGSFLIKRGDLSNSDLSFVNLAKLSSSVKILNLSNCTNVNLKQLPTSVSALDLSGCDPFSLDLALLGKSVRSLTLSKMDLSDANLKKLLSSTSVKSLNLSESTGVDLTALPQSLEYLNLSGLNLSGANLGKMVPRSVIHLNLANCTDVNLRTPPQTLEHLNLSNWDLSLVDLSTLPESLEQLRLSGCAHVSLSQLPSSLESLDLSKTDLSTVDLRKLPASVSYLKLSENSGVDLESLYELRPHLRVIIV